jgi:hypothetical protein
MITSVPGGRALASDIERALPLTIEKSPLGRGTLVFSVLLSVGPPHELRKSNAREARIVVVFMVLLLKLVFEMVLKGWKKKVGSGNQRDGNGEDKGQSQTKHELTRSELEREKD